MNLYLAWLGNRSAKLLIGSLPLFLIGAVLSGLVRLGVIRSSAFTEELVRFGLVWLIAFWSLALADRMNSLKQESETSMNLIMKNEKRMVQYLDSLPVGVLVYEGDKKPRYINRQAHQILIQPGIATHLIPKLFRWNTNHLTFQLPIDIHQIFDQLRSEHAIQQRHSNI